MKNLMPQATKTKKSSKIDKPILNSTQKTFDRLRKNVEKLHKTLKGTQEILNRALEYYLTVYEPTEKIELANRGECVKLFYKYYKASDTLTKKELKLLKELIIRKIKRIFSRLRSVQFDPELCAIYKEFTGDDYKDLVEKDHACGLKDLENMFKDQGFDIDLSDLNESDDQFDLIRKLMASMAEAQSKINPDDLNEESEFESKPKTKKQIEKETKIQELENLQKKGLSTIYKQLAKVLHPDLEQDPVLKKEKEEVMKKLSIAYENNDLHTLISLEITWATRSENGNLDVNKYSDDQLKIYNAILKEQIAEIQDRINMEYLNPKYISIQEFISEMSSDPLELMKGEVEAIKEESNISLSILQGTNPEKIIKKILSLELNDYPTSFSSPAFSFQGEY